MRTRLRPGGSGSRRTLSGKVHEMTDAERWIILGPDTTAEDKAAVQGVVDQFGLNLGIGHFPPRKPRCRLRPVVNQLDSKSCAPAFAASRRLVRAR